MDNDNDNQETYDYSDVNYEHPMCNNKRHTLECFEKNKGDMVLIDSDVLQFVAIAEDDNDYLYVFYDGRELKLHTILSHLTIIKNKIDDRDYNYFVRIAKLNYHSAMLKDEKFKEHHAQLQEYLDKLPNSIENIRYLSEFHWDLNYVEKEDGTVEDLWNTKSK
jgi:hypothetical protein